MILDIIEHVGIRTLLGEFFVVSVGLGACIFAPGLLSLLAS